MPDVQTAVIDSAVAVTLRVGLPGDRWAKSSWLWPSFDPTVLAEALRAQGEAESGRIGEILVQRKAITEEDVARALAAQLDLPFASRISVEHVDVELARAVPINFAKQSRILPLRREEGAVVVAVADPLDTPALDHARMLVGASLLPVVASAGAIVDAINAVYDRALNEAEQLVGEMEAQDDLDSVAHELEEPQDLLEADDEAPIIRLVNSLLFRAAKERASDIHIEPMERDLIVRFRIDGVLHEVIKPPKRYQNSIVSRVKVMGQLNIAEKRLPQDGRIRIKIARSGHRHPSVHHPRRSTAKRIVMRLLDKSSTLLDLERYRDVARSIRHPGRAGHSTARTASSWSPVPPARGKPPRSTRH